ncbi:hypothetical protein [Qipengyuania sp. 902]|uniref:hypothetical protein n=1 Tax=Qipengyuania sp. 902 TaxID=3417565 RepID=UPI003EB73866
MSDYYSEPLNKHLREAKGLARSAYAVEVNPWVPRGEVEAAIFFRGAIVSAYGYIETRIGELTLRISKIPQYAALREKMPYHADKRIAFLREAFSVGDLARFGGTADRFLLRFEAQAHLRHLIAHARMQVMPAWGVTFQDFPTVGHEGPQHRTRRMPLGDLEFLAWRAARLSRLGQHLMGLLEQTGLLPDL